MVSAIIKVSEQSKIMGENKLLLTIRHINVKDEFTLLDIDTKEDYKRLLEKEEFSL